MTNSECAAESRLRPLQGGDNLVSIVVRYRAITAAGAAAVPESCEVASGMEEVKGFLSNSSVGPAWQVHWNHGDHDVIHAAREMTLWLTVLFSIGSARLLRLFGSCSVRS